MDSTRPKSVRAGTPCPALVARGDADLFIYFVRRSIGVDFVGQTRGDNDRDPTCLMDAATPEVGAWLTFTKPGSEDLRGDIWPVC